FLSSDVLPFALAVSNLFEYRTALYLPLGRPRPRTGALQPRIRNAWPLTRIRFGLIPFRSPLLRESRLIYLPRGVEMFPFPRLSPAGLCVQPGVTPHYRRRVSPFGNPRVKGCSTPHRGLSQSSTPFFDSRCQGIHHVPLLS